MIKSLAQSGYKLLAFLFLCFFISIQGMPFHAKAADGDIPSPRPSLGGPLEVIHPPELSSMERAKNLMKKSFEKAGSALNKEKYRIEDASTFLELFTELLGKPRPESVKTALKKHIHAKDKGGNKEREIKKQLSNGSLTNLQFFDLLPFFVPELASLQPEPPIKRTVKNKPPQPTSSFANPFVLSREINGESPETGFGGAVPFQYLDYELPPTLMMLDPAQGLTTTAEEEAKKILTLAFEKAGRSFDEDHYRIQDAIRLSEIVCKLYEPGKVRRGAPKTEFKKHLESLGPGPKIYSHIKAQLKKGYLTQAKFFGLLPFFAPEIAITLPREETQKELEDGVAEILRASARQTWASPSLLAEMKYKITDPVGLALKLKKLFGGRRIPGKRGQQLFKDYIQAISERRFPEIKAALKEGSLPRKEFFELLQYFDPEFICSSSLEYGENLLIELDQGEWKGEEGHQIFIPSAWSLSDAFRTYMASQGLPYVRFAEFAKIRPERWQMLAVGSPLNFLEMKQLKDYVRMPKETFHCSMTDLLQLESPSKIFKRDDENTGPCLSPVPGPRLFDTLSTLMAPLQHRDQEESSFAEQARKDWLRLHNL